MNVYEVPVPEKFLPLVYRTLADAYEGEGPTLARVLEPSGQPPNEEGYAVEWTKEEVVRAYRESTPKQRIALDYLADNPDQKVRSRELAGVVYPDDSPEEAESRIYGVLGSFGTRARYTYGKKSWFFEPERDRNSDGSEGYMIYTMHAREAAWVREAGGRE